MWRRIFGMFLLGSAMFFGGIASTKGKHGIPVQDSVARVVVIASACYLILRSDNADGRPITEIADGEYVVTMSATRANKIFLLVEQRTTNPDMDEELNFRLYALPRDKFVGVIPEARGLIMIRNVDPVSSTIECRYLNDD